MPPFTNLIASFSALEAAKELIEKQIERIINKYVTKQISMGDFILTNGEKLAMIRALGHELSTVQKMNELTLPIELDDEVSILVATDGLWDVVYEPELLSKFPEYDAEDFMKLASDRWDQEWNYIVPSIFTDASGNAFPIEKMKVDSADDVGVVVYKRVSHSS